MSSSQIFIASSADLPLGASGPVSAMPKPMRSGSAALADKAPSASAKTASAAAPSQAMVRSRKCFSIGLSSQGFDCFQKPLCPKAWASAKGERKTPAEPSWRGFHPLDDDVLDLAGAAAPERRGLIVFGRGEAGDRLPEGRELDDDEAVEFLRPLHDPELAAAREHLAAVAGNDIRHEVGVFLVLDGIDDPRPGDPIGRHRNLLCASPAAADTLLPRRRTAMPNLS